MAFPGKALLRPAPQYARLLALLALSLYTSCKDNKPSEQQTSTGDNTAVTPAIAWEVVKEYPHDASAFTEGLEYRNGVLYESTGQYGSSEIRKVDLATGKVIAGTKLEARYFGEGLTLLNDKLYQLTYREGKGFIYDAKTLKRTGTFNVATPEGWGMTNNGAHLIFNDGGHTFHFMDPNSFAIVKDLTVSDEHGFVDNLNEPELINGYIYANIWQTDLIVKIDTSSGQVLGRADLSELRRQYGIPPVSGRQGAPDVLNGIAYEATSNRIFITGKNWPKLFEVKFH